MLLPPTDEQDTQGQMSNANRRQDVQDATLILVPRPGCLPTPLVAEDCVAAAIASVEEGRGGSEPRERERRKKREREIEGNVENFKMK